MSEGTRRIYKTITIKGCPAIFTGMEEAAPHGDDDWLPFLQARRRQVFAGMRIMCELRATSKSASSKIVKVVKQQA
jgi:hypothetical protein